MVIANTLLLLLGAAAAGVAGAAATRGDRELFSSLRFCWKQQHLELHVYAMSMLFICLFAYLFGVYLPICFLSSHIAHICSFCCKDCK